MQVNQLKKCALALALSNVILGAHAQTLEEVVVTAQHREENLQDVPIAITAIGSEELRTADISDLNAISVRTPGFSMGTFTPAQPQLFIRGVGSNADGAAEDQSVVLFLDGVYVGRTAGQAFDLFDLERIEILRGPQGTLYGKNAAGGAINVVSQKPSETLTGAVELSAGDMGYFSTRGKVSGPLSDTLFGKISFSYKERDGYVDSLVANIDDYNAFETQGIRAQLMGRPSDTMEWLLTVDYSDDSRTGPGRSVGSEFLQATIAGLGGFKPGFYQNMLEKTPNSEVDSQGISLQMDWDLGGGTLTSITAYREANAQVLDISFGVAFPYLGLGSLDNAVDESSQQFSQELRYATDIGDNVFLQTGFYFLNEDVDRLESLDIVCGNLCAGFSNNFFNANNPLPLFGSADQTNETNSYGIFAQAVWSANDRTDVTVGARYTRERKEATNVGIPDGAFAILAPYDVKIDESWGAFTPKAAVNYQLTDDLMAYASVSTGFKSGGFQGLAPTGIAASTAFDEETVTTYELGLKGTLLENSLRFNAAAFSSQYDDLQVLVLTVQPSGLPGPQLTANAGEAEIQGLELEAQWQVNSVLQLAATYAYLDTEYTQLDNDLAVNEGNVLRNAPENAYSLSAIVNYPLASGAAINARADFSHKDDAYQDIPNQEAAKMIEYDVLNLRASYVAPGAQWEVAAWVKNATDEEYLLHNSVLNPGLAQLPLPAAPRTAGITATWNFGD